MTKHIFTILLVILCLTFQYTEAQIPRTISYQGVLTDALGNPKPPGMYRFVFELYTDSTGGSLLWSSETQTLTLSNRGLFYAYLGPFPDGLKFDRQYWLQITVQDTTLAPRLRLSSVGYSLNSLRAEIATTVGDNSIDSTKLAPNSVTQSKIVPGVTLPPGGSAGGDLTGTYPNPTIAAGSVSTTKLADNTVSTAKIQDQAVTQAKIASGVTLPPGGSAGGDLTGTYPNPTIAAGAVSTTKLADNAVSTAKIQDQAVTQAKIASGVTLPPGGSAGGDLTGTYPNPTIAVGAVNTTKLADNSVTSAKIVDGTIIGDDIANSTIPAFKLSFTPGTVTSITAGGGLSGGTITTSGTIGIAPNGIITSMIGDGQVTPSKLSFTPGTVMSVTAGSGLSGGTITSSGTISIATGGVSNTMIQDNAISNAKLQSGAVTSPKVTPPLDLTNVSSGTRGAIAGNFQGVFGSAPSNYGVWGESNSSSYSGVYGLNTAIANFGYLGGGSYGVYGEGIRGIRGRGSTYGILGENASSGKFGYLGDVSFGAGVYGYGGGSTSNYAGYFYGNVYITGSISKGSGSFKIDHPQDPTNKYLYHSFVESPDMKNVYDGIAVLNAQGEAVVELPSYFEVLNKEFRYQLTSIGNYSSLYIAEEISRNRFTIAGGKPGQKVSWQVTGIRKDAYAEKYRIHVEEDKVGEERGRYLHPEAFGLPSELGISAVRGSKNIEELKLLETVPKPELKEKQ